MINIITINWNNVSGLHKTITSLRSQSLNKSEWKFTVIDGLSTDGSVELLIDNRDFIDTLLVEKDHGVYDAMNKGIEEVSSGDYFLFLNSGDALATEDILEKLNRDVLGTHGTADIIYGDKIDINGNLVKAYFPESMKYGIINACHQCILYKKMNIRYDLQYLLFSDLDFTINYYKQGAKFHYSNRPIAIYEGGGLSSIHKWKTKKEIYYIVFRQFGLLNFMKFLLIKSGTLFGIKHTKYLNKHIS